jgi:RNA polymerase sigma-70 factor (ECF subfamily)
MTDLEYKTTFDTYQDRLIGYVMKNTNDIELARDLSQEALLKLWNNRLKVPVEKVKSWLFTVTKNIMLNYIKRQKKFERINPDCDVKDETVESEFDKKTIILKELKTLDKKSQRLLILRDVHNLSYSELGERLKLSESQVKVYLFRARKKLKDKLMFIKNV